METQSSRYAVNKIRSLMDSTGTSNIKLAKVISKDRNTIKNYLDGATSIKIDDLQRIAEFFDVPVQEFFISSPAVNNSMQRDYSRLEQMLEDKNERIKELKEQIDFLRSFYKEFSSRKFE